MISKKALATKRIFMIFFVIVAILVVGFFIQNLIKSYQNKNTNTEITGSVIKSSESSSGNICALDDKPCLLKKCYGLCIDIGLSCAKKCWNNSCLMCANAKTIDEKKNCDDCSKVCFDYCSPLANGCSKACWDNYH